MGASDGDFYLEPRRRMTPVKPARSGIFKDGPVYKHSCGSCVYLLTYAIHGRQVDVYKCGGALLSGTVFRLSEEQSDETTMFESVVMRLGLNQQQAEELRIANQAKAMADYGGGTFTIITTGCFDLARATLWQ